MATKTFTASGSAPHLWSDTTKWSGGTLPADGDTVIIADDTICTIDMDTPNLAYIGTDGVGGTGRCILSDGVTVNFPDGEMEAGNCTSNGFFRFEATSPASCTINGDVKGGNGNFAISCHNSQTGTVNITGSSMGGSGDHSWGVYCVTAGTVKIMKKCTGGSGTSAYGCNNHGVGTIEIDGNALGGSGTNSHGAYNGSGGTIDIGGDCTGGVTSGRGAYQRGSGNAAGIIHIRGKTVATAISGCYIHAHSRGQVYFYDDLEDGAANAVVNDAGTDAYCLLGYGKKWYDDQGEEKVLPNWLITAEITNAEDLQMIETAGLMAGIFVQTDDIDMDEAPYNEGDGFAPIGTEANPFTGTYDGGNHTISNLFINRPTTDYVGLFGDVKKAEGPNSLLQNIYLINPEIVGQDCVGAIAGQIGSYFDVINCRASGIDVTGEQIVGGAFGNSSGSTSFAYRCWATGDVRCSVASAARAVGGLSGTANHMHGSAGVGFEQCYFVGTIHAPRGSSEYGGFAARSSGGNWKDCFAIAKFEYTGAGDAPTGLGSMVASVHDGYRTPIFTHCYAVGTDDDDSILDNFWGGLSYGAWYTTDCFYEGTGTSLGAVGKPQADLQDENEYPESWDFDDVWVQGGYWNDEYPYLRSHLTDADLPEKASTPTPAHEAEDVELDPDGELTLEWVAGDRTDTFNVYLGNELIEEDLDVETLEQVVELLYGTEYFWRVDTVNPLGTTEGDVWSFEVKPALSMGPITFEWTTDTTLVLTAGAVTGSVGDVTYTWHEYVDGSWIERLSGVDETELSLLGRDQEERYRFRLTVSDDAIGQETTVCYLTVGTLGVSAAAAYYYYQGDDD